MSKMVKIKDQNSRIDQAPSKILGVDEKMLKRFQEIRANTIREAALLLKNKNTKLKALGISGSARDAFDLAAEASNSEFLLKECLKELEHLGADTELLPLRKYDIKPCKACYSTVNTQCHYPCSCYPKQTPLGDDMSNILYDKILAADILIFATPVNNFKVSSFMSLFLDRCISLDGSLEPADPKATKNKELNKKHAEFVNRRADQKIFGSGFLKRFVGKTAGVIVTGHEEGASLAIASLFMTLNSFGCAFPAWSVKYAMGSVLTLTSADKSKVTGSAYINDAKDVARNTFNLAQKIKEVPKSVWQNDPSVN